MALLIAAIKCFRGKFTGFQKCYFSSQTKNVIVVLLLLLFIKKISIEQIISSNCLFKKKSKPHAHTTISKVCKSRFNINLVWKFFCCTSSGRETKLEKKEKKKERWKIGISDILPNSSFQAYRWTKSKILLLLVVVVCFS